MTVDLTLEDVRNAHARIKPYVHYTPILRSRTLNTRSGAEMFFKCENFQRVGAFKFRGATNAVYSLSDAEAKRGVVTHSSGNHGQALALAASTRGIPAYIVMPENTNAVKREAVQGYGGKAFFCEPTLQAREETAKRVIAETGAVFVHPYNDLRVIAGQGTAALELLGEVSDLDAVIAPVGGGGLLSGTAITVKSFAPRAKVYGAEPELADDAYRSFQAGKIIPLGETSTIADGLRTSLGELTFAIIKSSVDGILTVSETAIIDAMRLVWERMKIIIEPSAAVPVAALFEYPQHFHGKRVGVILSGGNVDLDLLPW